MHFKADLDSAEISNSVSQFGFIDVNLFHSYINQITQEVPSASLDKKYSAIQVLTVLYLYGKVKGEHMTALELLASPDAGHKKLANFAVGLLLEKESEAFPLYFNIFQKNISSQNYFVTSSTLATIATTIPSYLSPEITTNIAVLIKSGSTYVLKHANAAMSTVCIKHQSSIKQYFSLYMNQIGNTKIDNPLSSLNALQNLLQKTPELIENYFQTIFDALHDFNMSDMCRIVLINILKICLKQNKKNCAHIIPFIEEMLSASLESFGLYYEVASLAIQVLASNAMLIKRVKQRIHYLLECKQANTIYTGLKLLSEISECPRNNLEKFDKPLIKLFCSKDKTIQMEAMSLLFKNATKESFTELVDVVLLEAKKYNFENNSAAISVNYLIRAILMRAMENDYAIIRNLEWYVNTLFKITIFCFESTFINCRNILQNQWLDMVFRVCDLRPICLQHIREGIWTALEKNRMEQGTFLDDEKCEAYKVLLAFIFLYGEFSSYIYLDFNSEDLLIKNFSTMNSNMKSFAATASMKILLRLLIDKELHEIQTHIDYVDHLTQLFEEQGNSFNIQLSENCLTYSELLKILKAYFIEGKNVAKEIMEYFEPEMCSVSVHEQSKIICSPRVIEELNLVRRSLPEHNIAKLEVARGGTTMARPHNGNANLVKNSAVAVDDKTFKIAPKLTITGNKRHELQRKQDEVLYRNMKLFVNDAIEIAAVLGKSKRNPLKYMLVLQVKNVSTVLLRNVEIKIPQDALIEATTQNKKCFQICKTGETTKLAYDIEMRNIYTINWMINIKYERNDLGDDHFVSMLEEFILNIPLKDLCRKNATLLISAFKNLWNDQSCEEVISQDEIPVKDIEIIKPLNDTNNFYLLFHDEVGILIKLRKDELIVRSCSKELIQKFISEFRS